MYKKVKRFIYLFLIPFIRLHKYFSWRIYLIKANKIKLNVGAGYTKYEGWFNTELDTLDVTSEYDFKKYFSKRKIDNILAEHVLEHLTDDQLDKMIINFKKYCSSTATIRIAVPDGFHADQNYINKVKPGGTGVGADDHKHLFTYISLSEKFTKHGFTAQPIEYWNENHKFVQGYHNDNKGFITRSFVNDDRNKDGKPVYTSLIVDFTPKN